MSYEPLDPEISSETNSSCYPRLSRWQLLNPETREPISITKVALYMSLIGVGFVLVIIIILNLQSVPDDNLFHCGESAAEALAHGCHFDAMAFAWFPDMCFDEPLMLENLGVQNWTWYLDSQGHQDVDDASVRRGEYSELYVSWGYHLTHCTYIWRKLNRALVQRGIEGIDGYISNVAHTDHCATMLTTPNVTGINVTNTMVYAKYPACGPGAVAMKGTGWYRISKNGDKVFGRPTHEEIIASVSTP